MTTLGSRKHRAKLDRLPREVLEDHMRTEMFYLGWSKIYRDVRVNLVRFVNSLLDSAAPVTSPDAELTYKAAYARRLLSLSPPRDSHRVKDDPKGAAA